MYSKNGWSAWAIGLVLFLCAAAIWRPRLLTVLGASILDVALPPLWGGVLALLLAPAYRRLCSLWGNTALARTGAVIICYGTLLGTLTAAALLLMPQIARSAASLAANSGEYAANLWQLWGELETRFHLPASPDVQRQRMSQQLLSWTADLLQRLFPHLLNLTADLLKGLLQLLLGLFFSIYLLLDGPLLAVQATAALRTWLPEAAARSVLEFCALCRRMVAGWLTGQLLDCLVLGVCCSLGMVLLGFPFAALVGLLTGLCSLVPVVGGALGGILSLLLLLAVQPGRAVWFLVYYLVLQQLEGRFLYPRIVGSRLGLPPVLVLFAVLCGSELGGFLGILAALPASAVLYAAARSATSARRRAKQKRPFA